VLLRFGHDMTQRAIAERLGMSQVHVSRLLREALATLRGALEDAPAPPSHAAAPPVSALE
jgi:RNA polymerase sigma-B factor